MRFLIIASVLACAAAAPQSSLLTAPVPVAPVPIAPVPGVPVAALTPAPPTISAGDINGAAIEASVEAADKLRAAEDADRQIKDQVSELQIQAINNAEEQSWRALDAVKTAEARLDGAAANAAPVYAKTLVRSQGIAPVPYTAPVAPVPYTAPVAPVPYTAPVAPVSYSAPVAPVNAAAPIAYDALAAYGAYPAFSDFNYAL